MAVFIIQRILSLTTSSIQILFTESISTSVGITNVLIKPQYDSIPTPTIISVQVSDNVLTVNFSPLFDNIQYQLTVFSTDNVKFEDIYGDVISENGNTNVLFFVSPGENTALFDQMLNSVTSVYQLDAPSVTRNIINSSNYQIQKASNAIDTVQSSNYISISVTDELITRADGALDTFANGGAYEIVRVGSTPTGSNKNGEIVFNESRQVEFATYSGALVNPIVTTLPANPISLQSIDVVDEIVSDDINLSNFFDGLNITVSNGPVLQLIALALITSDNQVIPYDITQFGYILQNNSYDTIGASINVNLNKNQIQLSSTSITGQPGGFILPVPGDTIKVSYVYQKLGRIITASSVELTTVEQIVREQVPAVTTSFFLDNAPIVFSDGTTPVSGGVKFLNSQAFNGNPPLSTNDPAFIKEITFSPSSIPNAPGYYSVNYQTGQVFVYGADATHQGTGNSPAVSSYYYQKTFITNTDYTYDTTTSSLAVNSTRNISGIDANISFSYEDTFANGTDFRFLSHIEAIDERVNNNLIGTFQITTQNAPITDVFQVFNETTGEIYTIGSFNDTTITFQGNNAPKQITVTRETASFAQSLQETLLLTDTISVNSLNIYQFNLMHGGITDNQGRYVGANFDTSVVFSNQSIFMREFFYDNILQTVNQNLQKLQIVGDYLIDYNSGTVYVAVVADQQQDVGSISYNYDSIQTKNTNILQATNVYRSVTQIAGNVETYNINNISANYINFSTLENVGERFISGNPNRPIIVGSYENGKDGVYTAGTNIFSSASATFSANYIGFSLQIGSADDTPVQTVTIINVINNTQLVVSDNFATSGVGQEWVILNLSSGAPKTITLNNSIVSVTGIYFVDDLGTLPAKDLVNYFNQSIDTFTGNTITLSQSSGLNIGDAVSVDYSYGTLFVDYIYLADQLLVSYEYGPNALDWSISNSLAAGTNYYVSYNYGALRNALLTNFGALTQIPELTNFPVTFNREVYRSIVAGTLQSFITGPTIPSIEKLVEAFTDVQPVIKELAFDIWILGRDYLTLRPLSSNAPINYELAKFNQGVLIQNNNEGISVPAISHFRLKEGTLETWVKPQWDGYSNDASLTFNIQIDGYNNIDNIFIGYNAYNPTQLPFVLNSENTINIGKPKNIGETSGYFIWYDQFNNNWNVQWSGMDADDHVFTGSIISTGNFYNVGPALDAYGNSLNEVDDLITTTNNEIYFNGHIDGYNSPSFNNYSFAGLTFSSGNLHYIFDMAVSDTSNRVSLFNDGKGNLVFQAYDNQAELTNNRLVGKYGLSTNIQNWKANELHQVAITWAFNSANESDEMHLFVDGFEVPNVYKYGISPVPTSSNTFGEIATEVVINSASRPIFGTNTGQTSIGSALFIDQSTNFTSIGVNVGDKLYLTENNQDGTAAPNLGAPYNIIGVGTNSLLLDRNLTLTLDNVSYSINQVFINVNTPLTYQNFIVLSNGTELSGPNSNIPSYFAYVGSNNAQILSITNGVNIGDQVVIETLGLKFRECREKIYVYDGYQIRANSAAPVTLQDVNATLINFPRTLIGNDGYFNANSNGATLYGPSNSTNGKALVVDLSGENINFSLNPTITIYGTTFGGATSETLVFNAPGILKTTNYWTSLSNVIVSTSVYNTNLPAGAFQIFESLPINVSENNGIYAQLFDYSNGLFSFETYGAGGMVFNLVPGYYILNYPTLLRVRIDNQPDSFIIGNDYTFSHPFNGVLDEFRILSSQLTDTRPGDKIAPGEDTITIDYNSNKAFQDNTSTLLLAHLDTNITNSSAYRDSFNTGYELDPSLNTVFDEAIRLNGKPYIIGNGNTVFDNNQGTVEFWVSPLEDTNNDPNYRYFIDLSSTITETDTSITRTTVVANQKVRTVQGIYLATDTFFVGTNYFTGGSISAVDGKTITLGSPLPSQNTPVTIVYVPLSSSGDRFSIFKDPNGYVNFFITASGTDYVVSTHVNWSRHSWHRIMVMYQTNSANGEDIMRLFVDGTESGVVKYGTGLLYGTGVIYGSQEVRPGVNRFLTTQISLTDTFANIYVGTDMLGVNPAFCLMDNLRFSDIQRLSSIAVVGGVNIDLNYTSNLLLAEPVVTDNYTTGIYNFDYTEILVQYLATLYDPTRAANTFDVEVIDSFNKIIGNTTLENLLTQLINTIKPATSISNITFSN